MKHVQAAHNFDSEHPMTSPELDPNVTAAIEDSFAKQGLMTTIGAELHLVASGEVS